MSKNLKDSIIYEIYPTSFYDSNGDGTGDLNGITKKLDYVKDLGADIIWLNPFFKSPFKDGGYDISDYREIDKRFGTMQDFEKLIDKAHSLGLRVLIDLVIGHTSTEHKWFKQSAKEKKNKYSDYYIWTDSVFTPAPKCINGVYKRDGNYIVNYYAFQPALNYGYGVLPELTDDLYGGQRWEMHYTDERLKPLREEIHSIIAFWLNKKVDGFRVDLAGSLIKNPTPESIKELWNDFIGRARKINPDVLFIAEHGHPDVTAEWGFDMDYIMHESVGFNDMFRGEKNTNITRSFECGHSYFSKDGKGSKKAFIDNIDRLSKILPDGKYFVIPSGYHDIIRQAEKKGDNTVKCVFAFLLTYKNVPLIYYGDEIGIKHNYKVNKDGGYVRTGARTPMQWDETKNKGFSTADRLYLPTEKVAGRSVEAEKSDPNSIYSTVKTLIAIRKQYPSLGYSADVKMLCKDEYPLVYERVSENERVIVAINPTLKEYPFDYAYSKLLYGAPQIKDGKKILPPESFIIALV